MDFAELATRLISPRRRRAPTAVPNVTVSSDVGDVAVFRTGDGTHRALLLHGWEASHDDLLPTAAALANAGLTTFSPDLPAHGASGGDTVTIPEAARAILAVGDALGPFDLVVAHSVGAAIASLALKRGLRAKRVVLVTPPANYPKALAETLRRQGADDGVIAAVLDALRARAPDIDEMDSISLAKALHQEGVVVVASHDKVVAPEAGRAMAAAWPTGRLLEIAAGHQDVLEHPIFLEEVLSEAKAARGMAMAG